MWYMCCQHIVKCETSIAYRIRVFTFKHFARGIAMLMDEPNQNWTSMRIEMWTLSKSKRKCGAIIFALVWISKVVFTQLCANVVFCVLQVFGIIWCRSSKNAATILFVCFFFTSFFVWLWGECLFNELNWKVNTPSVTKWLVWAQSCQVFPRLNTIFHLCFLCVYRHSICHVYVGGEGGK